MKLTFATVPLAAWFFLVSLWLTTASAHAQTESQVAAEPVTNGEYLALFFNLRMHRHETEEALNSYNIVRFYQSPSPDKSLVVIFQTYNDNGTSTDAPWLRREIRQVGRALADQFDSLLRLPRVSSRWPLRNPKENLIVKHVRTEDFQDVLAVTIDGVTSFDPMDFRRAKERVERIGVAWAF